MATISEALAIAVEHHQAGRLQAAEQIYRQILAAEPNQADAWHLLGIVASQVGRLEVAVECIGRAIRLKGTEAAFHNNLGNVFKSLGRLDEATLSYRRALELQPGYAEAHNNLGAALKDQGNLDEAVACCRGALELKPDLAEAHYNLGLAFHDQGKLDEAIACYRRSLQLKPDYADAHNNLGIAIKDQGKLDEAVACYRRALELRPDYAEVHSNLGHTFRAQGKLSEAAASYRRAVELKPRLAAMHNNLALALQDQGKLEQAVVCFHHVLRLNPDDAETLSNLGDALCGQGRFDEAVACCRRAVELKPRLAVAHNNLGNAVQRQGKLGEAVACYRIALELKPDFAWAHNNLGNVLKYQGKLDEAVACYHRALELRPDFAEARSNLLYTLQYRAGATLAGLAAAHAEYQRLHAAPLRIAWRQHENVRDPDRPLRLGFVSPDFGRHPVGYFLIRALEHLDRDRWETICYCDRAIHDDLTARFRAAAAVWRDVSGSSDEDLAEMIRADRVDILFDLAGHTAHNRLLVFARKPAPIQITWIGYEGTTGLEAMDYLLADPHVVPPEADANYAERVLRLPQDYICYEPPCESSVVGPLPALVRGSPTFGSFNNAAKITPEVVTVWADILRQVPRASLVLKYRGMDDRATRSHYEELFAARGVPADRLDLRGWSNYAQMLSQYNEIDVALDPFPFGGGITTCNALWMGVPVVTCPGETFASRHGLSHLANVGLTETVARDLREYVQMAVSLAGDLPRLAALRAGLRQRMAASPLCDGKRLAGNLMVVLRDVWRQWVAQGSI